MCKRPKFNPRYKVSHCESFWQKYFTLMSFLTDRDRLIQRWQVYWSHTVLHWFWNNLLSITFIGLLKISGTSIDYNETTYFIFLNFTVSFSINFTAKFWPNHLLCKTLLLTWYSSTNTLNSFHNQLTCNLTFRQFQSVISEVYNSTVLPLTDHKAILLIPYTLNIKRIKLKENWMLKLHYFCLNQLV